MVWYPTNSGIDVKILGENNFELITYEDGFTSRVKNSGYVTKDFFEKKLYSQVQKFEYTYSKQGMTKRGINLP